MAREAGDQTMPPAVFAEHRRMRETRGEDLFVDMIRAIFPTLELDDAAARALWWEVVAHRKVMRARLGRRVPIIVAALDLLLRTRDPAPMVVVHEDALGRDG